MGIREPLFDVKSSVQSLLDSYKKNNPNWFGSSTQHRIDGQLLEIILREALSAVSAKPLSANESVSPWKIGETFTDPTLTRRGPNIVFSIPEYPNRTLKQGIDPISLDDGSGAFQLVIESTGVMHRVGDLLQPHLINNLKVAYECLYDNVISAVMPRENCFADKVLAPLFESLDQKVADELVMFCVGPLGGMPMPNSKNIPRQVQRLRATRGSWGGISDGRAIAALYGRSIYRKETWAPRVCHDGKGQAFSLVDDKATVASDYKVTDLRVYDDAIWLEPACTVGESSKHSDGLQYAMSVQMPAKCSSAGLSELIARHHDSIRTCFSEGIEILDERLNRTQISEPVVGIDPELPCFQLRGLSEKARAILPIVVKFKDERCSKEDLVNEIKRTKGLEHVPRSPKSISRAMKELNDSGLLEVKIDGNAYLIRFGRAKDPKSGE